MLTVLTLLLGLTAAAQLPRSNAVEFYTAAVVEYATPFTPNLSADQVLTSNAASYIRFMTNASASQVDIVVFPEGGLHGHGNNKTFLQLPSPADNIAPCDFNTIFHPALVILSCATRQLRLYAVINLGEKYINMTTNTTEYYNSNVALDRNGTVVGRYRKYNPYGDAVMKPMAPDHHYFETDFGVRFGMFTCFDIEFMEPALVMAKQYGIKHFAFPLCWISELPFLTALQMQWGWAYSLDVVLLAAGCNSPLTGGSGSGVYLGRQGALDYTQTNARISKLIIRKVPKSFSYENLSETSYDTYQESRSQKALFDYSGWNEVHFLDDQKPTHTDREIVHSNSSLFLLRDYLDVYKSQLLVPPGRQRDRTSSSPGNTSVSLTLTSETTLCHNDFCCDFQVVMTSTYRSNPTPEAVRGDDFTRLFYRLVVFDGVRWYGGGIATGGVQVCGIVSCANQSLTSCGLRADDPFRQVQAYPDAAYGTLYKTGTVFESISVTPTFYHNNTFVFPDLLVTGSGDSFGSLVPSEQFTFDTFGPYNNSLLCSLRVNSSIPNLVTAAVYARQFDRDGQNRTEASSHSYAHSHTNSVFVFCVFSLVIFNYIFFKNCLEETNYINI